MVNTVLAIMIDREELQPQALSTVVCLPTVRDSETKRAVNCSATVGRRPVDSEYKITIARFKLHVSLVWSFK